MADSDLNKKDVIVFSLLALTVTVMVAYGLSGRYMEETIPQFQTSALEYILMALLTMVGFGMLLNYFNRCTWTVMINVFYIVCLNVLLTPLLQKFWYSVITGGFGNNQITDQGARNAQYRRSMETTSVMVSFFSMRIALSASISLIVAMHSVIGRLNFVMFTYCSVIFISGWTASYSIIIHLVDTLNWNSSQYLIFDEFGSNVIFFFGAMFGFGLSWTMSCKLKVTRNSRRFATDSQTLVWAMIGTGFIFSLFAYLGQLNPRRLLNNGSINAFLALTGSVIMCYALSALIRGYIGIRESIYSVISGGIMIGILGGLIDNPGVAMSIGAVAGIVSTLWAIYIQPWTNRYKVWDSNGMISLYMTSSFLGSVVVGPVIIVAYTSAGKTETLINPLDPNNPIVYFYQNYFDAVILISFAILSAAIAVFLGMICGLISMCTGTDIKTLDDSIFLPNSFDFGTGPFAYMHTEDQSSVQSSISEILEMHISGIKKLSENPLRMNSRYKQKVNQ